MKFIWECAGVVFLAMLLAGVLQDSYVMAIVGGVGAAFCFMVRYEC